MVPRLRSSLASSATGCRSVYSTLSVFGAAIGPGLSPMPAAVGADEETAIRQARRHALVVSCIISGWFVGLLVASCGTGK